MLSNWYLGQSHVQQWTSLTWDDINTRWGATKSNFKGWGGCGNFHVQQKHMAAPVPSTDYTPNDGVIKATKKLAILNRAIEVLTPISTYTTSQYQPYGRLVGNLPLRWRNMTPVRPQGGQENMTREKSLLSQRYISEPNIYIWV